MKLSLEFGGGLELLFGNKKVHDVDVGGGAEGKLAVRELLLWARDNILSERPELFMKDDTVRPGILVLVNDTDWELSGRLDTELEEGDSVIFISTLHGG